MKATLNRRNFSKAWPSASARRRLRLCSPLNAKDQRSAIPVSSGTCFRARRKNWKARSKNVSSLGFHKFETFAEVLESWDQKGELGNLIGRYKVPLTSGYHDHQRDRSHQEKRKPGHGYSPGKGDQETQRNVYGFGGQWSQALGVQVSGESSERNRVSKDYAKAANDVGLWYRLPPAHGTAVNRRKRPTHLWNRRTPAFEVLLRMSRQLQKGGVDALQVVKDFLPILKHMHLKDFVGGQPFGAIAHSARARSISPAFWIRSRRPIPTRM